MNGCGSPLQTRVQVFSRKRQIKSLRSSIRSLSRAKKKPKERALAWLSPRRSWRCTGARSGWKLRGVKEVPFPSPCLRSNRLSLRRLPIRGWAVGLKVLVVDDEEDIVE